MVIHPSGESEMFHLSLSVTQTLVCVFLSFFSLYSPYLCYLLSFFKTRVILPSTPLILIHLLTSPSNRAGTYSALSVISFLFSLLLPREKCSFLLFVRCLFFIHFSLFTVHYSSSPVHSNAALAGVRPHIYMSKGNRLWLMPFFQ